MNLVLAFMMGAIAGILANMVASLLEQWLMENTRFAGWTIGKRLVLTLIMFVVFSIATYYWQSLTSVNISPESPGQASEQFEYLVHVVSIETRLPINNATVTLEVTGKAPLDEVTDSKGIARIFIESSRVGQPARLIVQASGYKLYVQNIDLTQNALPDEIQLQPEAPSTATVITTAAEFAETNIENQTQPTWINCQPPNLRDLIPVEGAISIVETIYPDMNSDGESEIAVLGTSGWENDLAAHLDIAVCDPTTMEWKNAIHEELAELPLEYSFDIEEVEIKDIGGTLILLAYYGIGGSGWGLDYLVYGSQNGQITLLLSEEGIRDGVISTTPHSLIVQSVAEVWAYEWDGKQFQRTDVGFIPLENSIMVRYYWNDGQVFVEQQNITLEVGQVLYLQRDRRRDDGTVSVFATQMTYSEAFEWVDAIGATGIRAKAPGENTVHIRPLSFEIPEVAVNIVVIGSSSTPR